jgi:hypothetical protein
MTGRQKDETRRGDASAVESLLAEKRKRDAEYYMSNPGGRLRKNPEPLSHRIPRQIEKVIREKDTAGRLLHSFL